MTPKDNDEEDEMGQGTSRSKDLLREGERLSASDEFRLKFTFDFDSRRLKKRKGSKTRRR
jgi:hypothetical protein